MKKTVFFILFLMSFCCLAEAAYVRKVREPQFFIPEKDKMHKPEKLPALPKKMAIEEKNQPEDKLLTEIPDYKLKYDKFFADMKVFEKTQTFPENPELESDLKAMETGEIFEVTADDPQVLTSQEQKEFYMIAKEILKN